MDCGIDFGSLPGFLVGLGFDRSDDRCGGKSWRPRLEALLALALAVTWFAGARAAILFLTMPLAFLAAACWFGVVSGRKLARFLVCGLPVITIIVCGAWPAYRVNIRIDDGMRVIEGGGVRLRWAAAGPSWPERGASWYEAQRICSQPAIDGAAVT